MEATDPLEANSTKEAVAVSDWAGDRAIAIGDEAKEEWIVYAGELVSPVR